MKMGVCTIGQIQVSLEVPFAIPRTESVVEYLAAILAHCAFILPTIRTVLDVRQRYKEGMEGIRF